jgi:hypothetical protein
MSELTIERRTSGSLGRVSLALGLLAVLVFFLGTVAGVFWFVGALVGLAALIAGFQALRGSERGPGVRATAIAGAVLGAAIAGWFVVYLVVEAVQ